jgi:hypothetical protein
MKVASRMLLLLVCIACIGAVALTAQDKSTTQVTPGSTTVTSQVERAEVVYVSGNDLVVKMENGEVRHLTVPDTARATVDGKELSIRDLKPGMKLKRTITTTTTAKTVTTVRTISGKVFQVTPPNTVILTFPDGSPNKRYQIPKDQVFIIDGQKKTAFDLRPGTQISATVVTEAPEVSTSEQKTVTGAAPPPPPKPATPPPQPVLLIEVPVPAPVPVAAARPAPAPAPEPAPTKLPKTASPLPLVGLIGLSLFGASLVLRTLRHWRGLS